MDKIKLEYKIPKLKTIEYNGIEIDVIPFISFAQQIFLINSYLKEYFNGVEALIERSEYRYIEAEFELINYILQLFTNINTAELENDIYMDDVLIKKILSEITNYEGFRLKLDFIVKEIKEQTVLNNSTGKIMYELIETAKKTIEKLSEITPTQLEEFSKTGKNLVDRLEKSSVLTFNPNAPVIPAKKTRKKSE